MSLNVEQLPAALARGLARVYLVSGDEPLLVDESTDAIRAAARAAGFTERSVFFIERGFDWDALRQDMRSPSLFADRRLIELRLPSGKPDRGAALLAELAGDVPSDLVLLIVTDQLDRKSADSEWVRAIERNGVWVPISPVKLAALPGWLARRARRLGLDLEPAAAEFIVERVEGNLLAAQQELDKLALLADGGHVDLALATQSVADSARYDVYQLAEAAAAGEAARALKVLAGLRSEGVEPTLILWSLVRELRGLWQARARERSRAHVPQLGWNQASRPGPRALARQGSLPLAALLEQAARADRIVKGLAHGDPWTALIGLTAALAGALQATGESGRVAV